MTLVSQITDIASVMPNGVWKKCSYCGQYTNKIGACDFCGVPASNDDFVFEIKHDKPKNKILSLDERDQELNKILLGGGPYTQQKGLELYSGNYKEFMDAVKRLTVADLTNSGFTIKNAQDDFQGMNK